MLCLCVRARARSQVVQGDAHYVCDARTFTAAAARPGVPQGVTPIESIFPMTENALRRNRDPEAVFVVSGASRGIGKAFVDRILAETKGVVFACCRQPSDALVHHRVRAVHADVTDADSMSALAEKIGPRVDVLINNVGILHDACGNRPERSLAEVTPEWLRKSFETNTMGAVLATQALAPAMVASRAPRS